MIETIVTVLLLFVIAYAYYKYSEEVSTIADYWRILLGLAKKGIFVSSGYPPIVGPPISPYYIPPISNVLNTTT